VRSGITVEQVFEGVRLLGRPVLLLCRGHLVTSLMLVTWVVMLVVWKSENEMSNEQLSMTLVEVMC
jgi:hypothetical protein